MAIIATTLTLITTITTVLTELSLSADNGVQYSGISSFIWRQNEPSHLCSASFHVHSSIVVHVTYRVAPKLPLASLHTRILSGEPQTRHILPLCMDKLSETKSRVWRTLAPDCLQQTSMIYQETKAAPPRRFSGTMRKQMWKVGVLCGTFWKAQPFCCIKCRENVECALGT